MMRVQFPYRILSFQNSFVLEACSLYICFMKLKGCTICKKDLPKTKKYFATRKDRKSLCYQSSCRKCHKEYRRKHYLNNKDKYIKKACAYNKKVFEWFKALREKLKCEKCGEDRHWVLDFHHNDPKTKDGSIGAMARKVGSKKRILEEIKKCKVLCSNCHRDFHYKQRDIA